MSDAMRRVLTYCLVFVVAFVLLRVSCTRKGQLDLERGSFGNVVFSKPRLIVQVGHVLGIASFAMNEKATVLASIGQSDSALNFWDLKTGRQYASCDLSHEDRPVSVIIADDWAFVSHRNGEITQWSSNDCKQGPTTEVVGDEPPTPAVIRGSDLLLTGSSASIVLLHRSTLSKATVLNLASLATGQIKSVAASDSGELIAAGTTDGFVVLMDRTGTGISVIDQVRTSGEIRALLFGVNQLFAIVGDNTIQQWKIDAGHLQTGISIAPLHSNRLSGRLSLDWGGSTLEFDAVDDSLEERDVLISWSSQSNTEIARHSGAQPHFCRSGCKLAYVTGNIIAVELTDGSSRTLASLAAVTRALDFHPASALLATAGNYGDTLIWNFETGQVRQLPSDRPSTTTSVSFSPDGEFLAVGRESGDAQVWKWRANERIAAFTGSERIQSLSFDSNASRLAIGYETGIGIWNRSDNRQKAKFVPDIPTTVRTVQLRGRRLVTAGSEFLREWDLVNPPQLVRSDVVRSGTLCCVSLSTTASVLATTTEGLDNAVHRYDTKTLRELPSLISPVKDEVLSALRFGRNDEDVLAAGTQMYVWNTFTGALTMTVPNPHAGPIEQIALSHNRTLIASSSIADSAKVRALPSGNVLTLLGGKGGSWVAVSESNQEFDTNNFEELQSLSWVFPDDKRHAMPAEIFMRDYYEPRLLARVLAGDTVRRRRSLESLNRVQPLVEISNVEWQDASQRRARVTVRVKRNSDEYPRGGKETRISTDPYDLRVFRNGQLVGWAPKTSVDWQLTPATRPNAEEEDLQRWREKTHIELDADGSKALTFLIQVPRRKEIKEVTFSAYAFNVDRVKSLTVTKTVPVPTQLQPVTGKAYVITIGVNQTESSPAWDLQYAANDARRLSDIVKRKLVSTQQFSMVIPIRLISDKSDQHQITELPATKVYLRNILDILAGRKPDSEPGSAILELANVEKAQPEDLVILSISSHGYTDMRGVFHLVLSDIGPGQKQSITEELGRRTLSSDEVSAWLRDVDAGELVMIVDACESEASIQTEGFKPGPMGSRGLGQLAYDKGMRVLAASKSTESAVERGGKIKDGLLSYALTEEGLRRNLADWQPKDGKITISEWLAYAEKRVPELFQEGDSRGFIRIEGVTRHTRDAYLGAGRTPTRYQQPVLFDFAREHEQFVIATH